MDEEVVVCILALPLITLRGGPSFEQVPAVSSVPCLEKRRSGRQ